MNKDGELVQWIERPSGVWEVVGSIPVEDSDFSLSHACVGLSDCFLFLAKTSKSFLG